MRQHRTFPIVESSTWGRRSHSLLAVAGLVAGGALLAACSGSPSAAKPPSTGPHHGSTTTSTSASSAGAPSTTTTTTANASSASCALSNLAVSLGEPNGAAGSTYFTITFVNAGSSPCSLYGYPGVSFLNTSNQQIGPASDRAPGTPPTTVLLGPSDSASATLRVTDPGIPPCAGSEKASLVRVYPPGSTSSVNLNGDGIDVCSSANTSAYTDSDIGVVTSDATGTETGATPACSTQDLALSLQDESGTAGHTYYEIAFENTSSTTCDLFGFPGVSFYEDGSVAGQPAQREPNEPVSNVTIAPGADGYAVLELADPSIPPCSSKVVIDQIKVYPPGDTQSGVISSPGTGFCASPDTNSYVAAYVGPLTAKPVG